MHAIVNHLQVSLFVDELRAAFASEGLLFLQSLPGFREFYFVKVSDDEAIVIILWADAVSADKGTRLFGTTWFANNVVPYLTSMQRSSSGEVVVRHQP